MSIYHMMSRGPHPLAGLFLNLAAVDVRLVPRLRDAHLEVREGVPVLRVLCRAGNPSAEGALLLDQLMTHPNVISKENCGVDSTYCEVWFRYRTEFHEALARVAELLPMPPPFSEAFPHYLAAVKENTPFPWVKNISEEGVREANDILSALVNALMEPLEGGEQPT